MSEEETLPAVADGDGRGTDSKVLAISNAMVRLYKEQFGRGPTEARTYWAGHNLIVVALHDTLTPAERNLQRMGEHERLRDVRMFFQYSAVQAFCEPVERITGRRVRSFVSGMDTQTDMALEAFELWPAGTDAPARWETADLRPTS
jgi:uncharacterized protein YbcI